MNRMPMFLAIIFCLFLVDNPIFAESFEAMHNIHNVWGIGAGDQVYRYNNDHSLTVMLSERYTQIAIGCSEYKWAINTRDEVFQLVEAKWEKMVGIHLKHISVGADGDVWGVNANNEVYRYQGQGKWAKINGQFRQIAVGTNGTVWGVNANNEVYRWIDARWKKMGNTLLKQVSVGADGTVWGVNDRYVVFEYNYSSKKWAKKPGRLKQISVGNNKNIWGVGAKNEVYHWVGSDWVKKNISLSYIAAGGFDCAYDNGFCRPPTPHRTQATTWGIDAQKKVYRYSEYQASSQVITTGFTQIAVGCSEDVWALDAKHFVYRGGEKRAWKKIGLARVIKISKDGIDRDHLYLKHLSVGNDGVVFGVDTDHNIYRHKANNNWIKIEGRFRQVSVGNDHHIWGVGIKNEVYQWNGLAWEKKGTILLKQVSVGSDGVVWGVNKSDEVYRYYGSEWDKVTGCLKQISVGDWAQVWGVNAKNEIYKWNELTWEKMPGNLSYVALGGTYSRNHPTYLKDMPLNMENSIPVLKSPRSFDKQ